MNITNAKYIKDMVNGETTDDIIAISCAINGVVSTVPKDLDNTDYLEIMRQVEAKELTIADAD
jgi:hypothetical protein